MMELTKKGNFIHQTWGYGGGLKPTIPYEWRPEYPFRNYFAGSMRIHDLWTQLHESIAGLQTWNFFKPSCRKICRASLAAFRPSWHGNLVAIWTQNWKNHGGKQTGPTSCSELL